MTEATENAQNPDPKDQKPEPKVNGGEGWMPAERGEDTDKSSEAVQVVQSQDLDVRVSSKALDEALVQLKRLTELRQQESARQKLAITEMQDSIKQQSRAGRLVLGLCVVILLGLVALALRFNDLTSTSDAMHTTVATVGHRLATASDIIRIGTAKQAKELGEVRNGVADVLSGQTEIGVRVEKELQSTRNAVEEQKKETALGRERIVGEIASSVALFREERDGVRHEVRRVLDDRTRALAAREALLRSTEESLRDDVERARDQRRQVMHEAIERLAELGDTAPAGAETVAASVAPTPAPSGLAEYRLVSKVAVKDVGENLSGLAFSIDDDAVFGVINNPPGIVEMDRSGVVRRTISLDGFEDTEDIVHIGGHTFGLVEERRRTMALVEITPETERIDISEAKILQVDPDPSENVGVEGLAYDFVGKRFFAVKEKDPRRIYSFLRPEIGADAPPEILHPWDIEAEAMGMSDLSSVFFDVETGHLFLLSDESKCIVEATSEGEEIARLSLDAGSAGLEEDIPQPEGITVDELGTLYICSEPNLFYVFRKGGNE